MYEPKFFNIHSFIHLSSSRRRLTTMDFHLFLSSAILFASPYVLRPVHSVISSIHILLGLPLGFFPYILPSRIYNWGGFFPPNSTKKFFTPATGFFSPPKYYFFKCVF